MLRFRKFSWPFPLPRKGSFKYSWQWAKGKHPELGYDVSLFVPSNAMHRPAVACFVKGEYYEPFSHLCYHKILQYKGGGNVVHAGTYFGDMLHTLSLNADTVYAFEPVLENYIFAKHNQKNLGLKNVVLMNSALGDTNGTSEIMTLTNDGVVRGGGSTLLPESSDSFAGCEPVTVFRLDDLPIDNISLLQLDVEGFELPVLKGAVQLITKCQPVILVEDNNNDCGPFLTELGYDFCFNHSGLSYWSVPCDQSFVSGLQLT